MDKVRKRKTQINSNLLNLPPEVSLLLINNSFDNFYLQPQRLHYTGTKIECEDCDKDVEVETKFV